MTAFMNMALFEKIKEFFFWQQTPTDVATAQSYCRCQISVWVTFCLMTMSYNGCDINFILRRQYIGPPILVCYKTERKIMFHSKKPLTNAHVAPVTHSTTRPSVGSIPVATAAKVPITQKVEGVLKSTAGHILPGETGRKLKVEGAILEGKPLARGTIL